MRKLIFLFLLFPLALSSQQEVFKNWQTTGVLRSDGTLELTDEITVVAAGDRIKRGITRGLGRRPIGDDVQMGNFEYDIISASRDGAESNFHTENERGQKVVYFGDKDKRLAPGTYRYDLRFTAPGQIYFLDQVEEIRWPVIGMDNQLPVEAASFSVEIPADLKVSAMACYTGRKGSTEQACRMAKVGNRLNFELERPLAAGEGFTVSAGFPAGSFVQPAAPPPPPPPTPLEEKGTLYLGLLGLMAALFYGYNSWQKYGVDPPTPDVGPQFYPPNELSPASVGYINTTMITGTQITASLTALAIKGYLEIAEEKRKSFFGSNEIFILRPQDGEITPDLPPEQQLLYAQLLDAGEIELDGKYDKRLEKITKAHNERVQEQHQDFVSQGANGWKVLPFGLILLGTVIAAGIFVSTAPLAGKIVFGLAVLTLIIGTPLFAWLIRKPSPEKVAVWEKIKQFQAYLKLSEKKRRQISGAPEMTEAYFQQVLPYAIVLGIENNWAEDLQSDLSGTLGHREDGLHMSYLPWMLPGFGAKMGSAYGAVSSPPSSGGGGGFSGGGGSVGGGGGGGGW